MSNERVFTHAYKYTQTRVCKYHVSTCTYNTYNVLHVLKIQNCYIHVICLHI